MLRAVNEDITSERHESPPAQSLAGCALSTNDFVVLFYCFMVLSCFGFVCASCFIVSVHICWPGVLVFRSAIDKELKTLRGRSRPSFLLALAKNASARCHQDHQVFRPARIGKAPPIVLFYYKSCLQSSPTVSLHVSLLVSYFAEPN